MRYRILFPKRLRSDGQESSLDPTSELDAFLAEGVVAEKVFVERLESPAQHSQEALDEDDSFLGMATPEVWEYEIVDGRVPEFEDAIKESNIAVEWQVVDESQTSPDDAGALALSETGTRETGESAVVPGAEELAIRTADDPSPGLAGTPRQPPAKESSETLAPRKKGAGLRSKG